jgi:hypothetical protein
MKPPDSGKRAMNSFQLIGLDPAPFEPLFLQSDEQLQGAGIVRRIASENPGFPCRVSLEDAEIGDELLLLPYTHHAVVSPYQAAGPIFIRRGARQRTLAAGEVPAYVTRRLISLRAYDAGHMMIDALVCEGRLVADKLEHLFDNPDIAYIHLHNAKQGCFSCLAQRIPMPH